MSAPVGQLAVDEYGDLAKLRIIQRVSFLIPEHQRIYVQWGGPKAFQPYTTLGVQFSIAGRTTKDAEQSFSRDC